MTNPMYDTDAVAIVTVDKEMTLNSGLAEEILFNT